MTPPVGYRRYFLTNRARLASYVRQHHLALIALFIALGGVSYAAAVLPKNSVGTKQLKRNAVVSGKVADGSLLRKDFRKGQLPRTQIDPTHYVKPATSSCSTSPGAFCMATGASWVNFAQGYAPVGYFKDAAGVVHLQGAALFTPDADYCGDNCGPVFYLPPGYRPTDGIHEAIVYTGNGTFQYLDVHPNGAVHPGDGTLYVALDGVSFRAGTGSSSAG